MTTLLERLLRINKSARNLRTFNFASLTLSVNPWFTIKICTTFNIKCDLTNGKFHNGPWLFPNAVSERKCEKEQLES